MQEKILTFIINEDNKFLLLKGNSNDPQLDKSIWYVVTGSKEDIDKNLFETVKREVKEETNLDVNIDDKYTSIYDPKLVVLFGEELFYQELSGVYNWGLMNYVKNLDSIVKNELYHRSENILLMVKKSEIDKIISLSKSNAKIFCNIYQYQILHCQ